MISLICPKKLGRSEVWLRERILFIKLSYSKMACSKVWSREMVSFTFAKKIGVQWGLVEGRISLTTAKKLGCSKVWGREWISLTYSRKAESQEHCPPSGTIDAAPSCQRWDECVCLMPRDAGCWPAQAELLPANPFQKIKQTTSTPFQGYETSTQGGHV